jgi:hypothetical protein
MNTIVTIIELVELGALITLVIYLIRLTRDNSELDNRLNRSELIDRNLAELNEFNGAMVADPDIARIWQDGCNDHRLNDIDRSRFALMASQYLAMLANQTQRAESIDDGALAESATKRLVQALKLNPGLAAAWETVAGDAASMELRQTVTDALAGTEAEEAIDPLEAEQSPDEAILEAIESEAPAAQQPASATAAVSVESIESVESVESVESAESSEDAEAAQPVAAEDAPGGDAANEPDATAGSPETEPSASGEDSTKQEATPQADADESASGEAVAKPA